MACIWLHISAYQSLWPESWQFWFQGSKLYATSLWWQFIASPTIWLPTLPWQPSWFAGHGQLAALRALDPNWHLEAWAPAPLQQCYQRRGGKGRRIWKPEESVETNWPICASAPHEFEESTCHSDHVRHVSMCVAQVCTSCVSMCVSQQHKWLCVYMTPWVVFTLKIV